MKQYLDLLKTIKEKGCVKPPARTNMPSTLSLFGHQYICDLSEGFPLLTTKKLHFKGIATELIWFLRGGNPLNIKFLIDNGCNIWNKDAYGWYLKKYSIFNEKIIRLTLEEFINEIKTSTANTTGIEGYTLGDCPLGYELWRDFNGVDQISELVAGLSHQPEGRRHLLTALNPAYKDVALAPCHVLAQFNCRPLTHDEREEIMVNRGFGYASTSGFDEAMNHYNIPKYKLDCQLYQRSCDVFLGVPYNTASYALLTHILAKITNMVAGNLIHTFGDVHIYDNHMKAVETQLERTPTKLPTLHLWERKDGYLPDNYDKFVCGRYDLNEFINSMSPYDFTLSGYNPQEKIEAELSTGL